MKKHPREIKDYDELDTTQLINTKKSLHLKDLGFELPKQPPTQVVSLRLPTALLNRLRAQATQQDIPYQSLIKVILSQAAQKETPLQ